MQGIIEVEPKAYLDFEAEDNKLAHAQLTIKNLTLQEIAFKIKTTAPQLFQVKPSYGAISSNQALTIEILTLQPVGPDSKFEAKFQINACLKSQDEQDLNTLWRNRDQSTIQSLQIKSRIKPQQQQEQIQAPPLQQSVIDNRMFESSIANSTHSDSKMFKSIKEDNQKDEMIKQYQEQLEKLQQEFINFRKLTENERSLLQLQNKEKNTINTKQVLVIVIIALIIGYFMGK